MADKMLDRVSKLLNQAENASTPEEAQAFMEKVQVLASAHSIDLALARAHQSKKEKPEDPEERRFKIGDFTSGYRVNSNAKWLVELFLRIASVNDVRCTISHSNIYVYGHGFPSDLTVCEKLYTVLAHQMITEADAALKRGDHKISLPQRKYRYIPGTDRLMRDSNGDAIVDMVQTKVSSVDGRIWRANFYEGFIDRIHGRLWNAKRQAQKDAGVEVDGSTESSIAVRDKKSLVDTFYEEQHKNVVLSTHESASTSQPDYRAQHSGGRTAERANIGITTDMERSRKVEID